jgi:lipoate---protein ligase
VKLVDHTYADPAANLACDEAFLQQAEANGEEEVLRFWESPTYFVVLGYSRPAGSDANLESCRREKIPVLRRCSGGGTVLQGPGCLNYALVLRCEPGGPLATITETNRYVLGRNLCGMRNLRDAGADIRGQSDLALDGRKFSGNAQRRSARWVLFHGTILIDFDIERIGRFLPLPSKQPAYRNGRGHHEFLFNTGLNRERLKQDLCREWGALQTGDLPEGDALRRLVLQRYSNAGWIYRM